MKKLIPFVILALAAVSARAAQSPVDTVFFRNPSYWSNPDLNINMVGVDDMAWTWWFNPQVWSVNDVKHKLWWGYTSTQRYAGIAEYDPTDGMYKKTHLKQNNSRDDHNNSIVLCLPDKRVACIYADGHDASNRLFVRISKGVECIDEFEEPVVIKFPGTTTYVQYFYMMGKHYLFTRIRQKNYGWAYTCSEDMVNWSEPVPFISATDKRYYIKLQQVSDVDGVIRVTAYGHPTQSTDSNIRMGFINFNDGNIYDKDGKTVVTRLGECFYYTDLSVAIAHREGWVFRLFDVARTPMSEYTVSLATFTKNVKTDSRYLIYNNGTLHDICCGGQPFWMSSVYLGGIAFIDGTHAVVSRNDGKENFGTDYVEIWNWNGKKWKIHKEIVSEPVTADKIRNIRPIVDYNKRYILWQRGSYDHEKKGTSSYELEARIYDMEQGKIVK